MANIKREDTATILKKLDYCQRQLQKGNVYSCLVKFKEALEKTLHTKMLSQDEREVHRRVSDIEHQLSLSKPFRDAYGPVAFPGKDARTTLEFLKQLIQVEEDEITAPLKEDPPHDAVSPETITEEVISLLEEGDADRASELVGENDELISMVVNFFNARGIQYRMQGQFDQAIEDFRKALAVSPKDEGLYYNIARSYMGREDWVLAREAIEEALKIDPEFAEGIKMKDYLERRLS